MTMNKHFTKILTEIAMVCGGILIIYTLYQTYTQSDFAVLKNLWAMVLLGATLTLRGESMINFHGLSESKMRVNFLVTSVLSDITLIILLYWYTPGGAFFHDKAIPLLIAYIVARCFVYFIFYVHTYQSAKEINKKLQEIV